LLKTLEAHYAVDRRKGDKPIPDNIEEYLNDLQMQAVQRLESIGYKLKFVRRPLFLDVIAVVSNPQEHKIAMLKVDGSIDFFPGNNLGIGEWLLTFQEDHHPGIGTHRDQSSISSWKTKTLATLH
jgi:hypothetical protein